ncbi:uncharacterized protein LOC122501891 [Leptopilina heterotoma]|uniref:uncharacterized protein LOC122501891 n=1 Tax=Leptopilina heterotoma TaxID=63436 RepID=UPI001CA9A34D|nr:uncharacterized protein LOC122501891 [Leptopilina heterotoma]
MYKFICLLFVCVAFVHAVDHKIQVKWGKVRQGLTILVNIKRGANATNITWNGEVTENKNRLRATYEFTYIAQNKTRTTRASNLCTPAKKGSFDEVVQTFLLKTLANSDSCPIKKGTMVSYKTPFDYSYAVDESFGCGEFRSKMKLFRSHKITDLIPVLVYKFGGTITGC